EYLAADNPLAASRTVQGIYERAQDLMVFPEIGYRYLASSRHVRILLYGHYRVAYLVTETSMSSVFFTARSISRGINCNCMDNVYIIPYVARTEDQPLG